MKKKVVLFFFGLFILMNVKYAISQNKVCVAEEYTRNLELNTRKSWTRPEE